MSPVMPWLSVWRGMEHYWPWRSTEVSGFAMVRPGRMFSLSSRTGGFCRLRSLPTAKRLRQVTGVGQSSFGRLRSYSGGSKLLGTVNVWDEKMSRKAYKTSIPAAAGEVVEDYHPNGEKKSASYFVGEAKVGFREWFEDGQLSFEYAMQGGVKHGHEYRFYP